MPDNAIRTNRRGALFYWDGTDFVFGRMHMFIQDADVSPERILARCDEFYEWAGLLASIQDDSPSMAKKAQKAFGHLLPRLAGDGNVLGLKTLPLLDFKDHITNCRPSEWYGWQYHAAVNTVDEIRAKAKFRLSNNAPTDAEVDAVLVKLGINGNEHKTHDYPVFLNHQITSTKLRKALQLKEIEASPDKGKNRANQYLVRSVVRRFFPNFNG
jgi:hypothetical protein